MKYYLIKIIKKSLPILDLILIPFTFISSVWFLLIRKKLGIQRMRFSRVIFDKIGILPVHDHYYEPLVSPKKHIFKSLRDDRNLKGINLNIKSQLELLSSFKYNDELKSFPFEKNKLNEYYYNNDMFGSGDSEFLYNIIRFSKPKKIIEIGSGDSTKMMLNGIKKNFDEDKNNLCELTCIEPYRFDEIKDLNVNVIKKRVEFLDVNIFKQLNENDILFIDSSHIIRTQGDVLFEFNEILPILNKGVLIHIHDIFTPKDYLDEFIFDKQHMWNEQYLLESFLSFNKNFEVIGSLNHLKHNYWNELTSKCPVLHNDSCREPGSFWIRRID